MIKLRTDYESLPRSQRRLMEFLVAHRETHQRFPTHKEIKHAMGWASIKSGMGHLMVLSGLGFLYRWRDYDGTNAFGFEVPPGITDSLTRLRRGSKGLRSRLGRVA